MQRVDADFKERVYEIVGRIPQGKVATYGQVAALAGAAWAAWEVGQIAHTGPKNLPWQRVVNKQGGMARGYPGGMEGHKQALLAEGVEVSDDYKVKIDQILWQPVNPNQNSLL
ncbi:MAG TPA: MGMT family protein [Candidatus Saccharimonadales bacterium]|nr:MGMT family protein [Candidatus Saccharimonadales bacterium]